MARRLLLFVLGTSLLASSALAEEAQDDKAVQKKVIAVLNGKGAQIDQCVDRYVDEFPAADGTLTLTIKVGKEGAVTDATVDTKLGGARNLRPCVAGVAKGYEFPPPSKEVSLTLTLVVKKGAKFRLYGPGETPPAPKPSDPPGPVFNFMPFGWNVQN